MKTRTALIYLAVFLVLAGYFYYFEVVRREARLKEEEAARKLFEVEKDQVTALKLAKTDAELISLKKSDGWRIVDPLNTRADELAVGGLLTALETIKVEREVKDDAEDLKPYGLDEPKLRLSFLEAGTWHHLRVGTKAVVGDNFYASGDQENRVVLISSSGQRLLDKSLFDLRSKDLFSLKSEEVDAIEIKRSDNSLALARVEENRWQAADFPNLKIKTSKVESLVNRLVWLRAIRFLHQEQTDVARLGLDPAHIRISLSAKEKTVTLLLGNTEKSEGVYAKSEELPGVAMVDENLLKELPGNLPDLEDRTFLAFKLDQIRALTLEVDGETGRLERDGEKWKWAGDSDRKDPESWLVNSLLWKIQDLEYLPESPTQEQSPPETKMLNLALFSENENEIGTFVLAEVPAEKAKRGLLWFFKGGETKRSYLTSVESLQDLHESAKKLMTPES
jgi:hypothetical protein